MKALKSSAVVIALLFIRQTGIFVIAPVLHAQQPGSSATTKATLDFEFFRTNVQPIFLHKRPGNVRCYVCHAGGGRFSLQRLSPGSTSWNEEESRRNFEAVQRLVVPGDPLASRLLMKPLAEEAGGERLHQGGKHWQSQNNPEWQTLATWVRARPASSSSVWVQTLDFQSFRAKVEPILVRSRDSGSSCVDCHSSIATRLRLQPLANSSATWTEDQSRLNFEAVARLVVPGDPLKSRLLLHPLAIEAGGDETHTGGKFWKSQSDPEWQTLAEWVRAVKPGTTATTQATLDFEFFRTNVQPIFLHKRPGNVRCYVCHTGGGRFGLQRLSPGSTSWNEEESRRNFEAVQRLVVPGDPLASRLLMKPLAEEAGGERLHQGGKHWQSQNDPEWQALGRWVRGADK